MAPLSYVEYSATVNAATAGTMAGLTFAYTSTGNFLYAGVIAGSVGILYVLMHVTFTPTGKVAAASTGPVTFADARHVIDRRCVVCHSSNPSDLTFGRAPGGVAFDTPEQIVARAARIRERAVVTRTMPPANKTHITDAERAILARWLAQGGAAN